MPHVWPTDVRQPLRDDPGVVEQRFGAFAGAEPPTASRSGSRYAGAWQITRCVSERFETRLDKQKSQTGDGLAFVLESCVLARFWVDLEFCDARNFDVMPGAVDVALNCHPWPHAADFCHGRRVVVVDLGGVEMVDDATILQCNLDAESKFHDAFLLVVVSAVTRLCLPETSIADRRGLIALRDAVRSCASSVSKQTQNIRVSKRIRLPGSAILGSQAETTGSKPNQKRKTNHERND